MAAGTLAVLLWAPGPSARLGVASVAGTMAFTTFVFFQVVNLLNVRHETRGTVSRETLRNTSAFVASGSVVALLVLVVQVDGLHGRSAVLWVGELVKVVLRCR
ncbi:cation transporting ATPase C-terminal domain-containing protein [Pseudonocardia abyssalis]|jgi:Ca2+-transporting ATPase|uniref:Cation transporting ATPase C-terminal domain-containing protein n=1 Tax=Pseudonocardia abyssalis TaxID=2792008 RepID=A0ABS6UQ27_9PSEU|nr:cation transporting ATPase C-terminal domain-containing protein [Pseudonocardia abyssalis]MBW0117790.1 cation transporting ATPase C-terminal domain-containing protein [Pseudonocardia abyssalis]MBW0133904.1 cation transporting ATPase C-terminal domain-containing protein [Pseudonocardia abyssalis]